MNLEELEDEALNNVLSLDPTSRVQYFDAMLKNYYPHIEEESDMYYDIIETYISSFYLEKLYRSNRFFQEKYTPVYTNTGLIRNVIADIYFAADHLITH